MSAAKCEVESFTSETNFWSIRKGNARMGVIQLNDGKLCLVSPIASIPKETFDEYTVSHLLAPNHYHNKSLSEYVARYPGAQICSSTRSKERLEKITGLAFKPLTAVKKKLPNGFAFIEPKGLKTGEIWIKFPLDRRAGWFVVDAFSGRKMTSTKNECNEPEILKTFPSYGIADRAVYKQWAFTQIKKDKPTLIIPCHGSMIGSTSLPAQLEKLLNAI